MAGLAGVVTLGIVFLILSCALFSYWWPMFSVAFMAVSPLPVIFMSALGRGDPMHDEGKTFLDIGLFFSTFFVCSGLAFPIVLAHAEYMKVWALVLSLLGGVFIYSGILAFLYVFFIKEKMEEEDII